MNKNLIDNKNKLGTLNIDGHSFECPLVHDLDDSIQGAVGVTGRVSFEKGQNYYDSIDNRNYGLYSNTTGANSYVTPETIQAGTQLTTAIISGLSNKNKGNGCKKPSLPESFLNRGKWSNYKICIARQERDAEIAQERIRANQAQANAIAIAQAQALANSNRTVEKSNFPTGLAIGIGVTIFLAVGGFITYKIIKSKK